MASESAELDRLAGSPAGGTKARAGRPPTDEPGDQPAHAPLIVGIGASAGGLDAFKSFFTNTPPDTGMGFVLVQHLSPDHKSLLAELLSKTTSMAVVEAADGMEVEANGVFVIPPDATMTIKGGRLEVVRPAPPRDRRRPIDTFLQSLAEDQGENAIGVILSGTGSDGALGLATIKEKGGLTLAQAEFDHHALPGMPLSATATGQVDDVLAVEAMPARIVAHGRHLVGVADNKDGEGTRNDTLSHLAPIMTALRVRSGHDFSGYKEKTLVRRLQRRMQVLQLSTPAAYIARFREQPEELDLLFRELLIGVTQFFRDPAAHEALFETVLKELAAGKGADDEIRIWVPGCATGQEAFTIAILLREAMEGRRPRPTVQIFGTDIDERAIAIARSGRYHRPAAGLPPDYAERWFTEDGDHCCVVPEIRDMCMFSAHSLIKHPPFSRLDLISCRNLLIYLDSDLQDRVMRTFHYALKPGGRLFLGSSESVTRATKLFAVEDKKHRIFLRREVDRPSLPHFSTAGRGLDAAAGPAKPSASSDERIDKSARRVMEKYTPPHVVIDRHDQIVRFSGAAMGQYLEPSPGAPSFGLYDILRKTLRPAVRAALTQAKASTDIVSQQHLPLKVDGRSRLITLIVEPLPDQGADAGAFLLVFQDIGAGAPAGKPAASDKGAARAVEALELEVRTTRAQLQATIDELEIANEELKSSNEEYQSVNEEFQSSNEELETAKEEMQSVNEEVQTINAEMVSKNELLTHLNSDIKNLLESTEIATLFLDSRLRVRSFTRGVTDVFHLRESDIGRPITEIVGLLDYPQLPGDVKTVLRKLSVVERQVTLRDAGMTFTLRVRPYRTIDNVIDGVVLTFVDITAQHSNDEILRETEAYLRLLIDSVADAICCVDREGVTTLCNASFLRVIGIANQKDIIGVRLHDLVHHSHPDGSAYARDDCPIYQTAQTGEPAHRDDELFFRPDGVGFPVEYWSRPIMRGGVLEGAVCTFIDSSDHRRSEEQQGLLLREMDHRVKNLFAIVGGVVTLSARSAASPSEMAATIQGRLGALAAAHLLIRPRVAGSKATQAETTLGELIQTVLAPYIEPGHGGEAERMAISGPDVPIGGDAVTSLALVFHELATNAAKYGSFSTTAGRVHISWSVKKGRLSLTWEERGGPEVAGAPEREGFGSLLSRRSVNGQLDGKLVFSWNREGLIVRLSAPTERLTS
jgi:two-component system, chemotaxis family, CheB/CheR fusion protein